MSSYAPEQRSTPSSINSVRSRSRTSLDRWLGWIRNTVDLSSALLARSDNRHRHVFALALALGAGGLIASATALTTAIASVHRPSTGSYQVVLAGLRFTYPTVNSAGTLLLAIAALGAAAVTIAVRASWRQRRRYRGFIGHIGPNRGEGTHSNGALFRVCRGCGPATQPRNGKGDAYAYCKAGHPGAIRRIGTR
jgi:hypothetical protein